jgi:hypothetical protein
MICCRVPYQYRASVETDGLGRYPQAEHHSSGGARPSRDKHIEPPEEDIAPRLLSTSATSTPGALSPQISCLREVDISLIHLSADV